MTRALLAFCLLLTVFIAARAQSTAAVAESVGQTPEERLIRTAYAKLVLYNRAAALEAMRGVVSKVSPNSVLKFELTNFRTGPLEDIKHRRISELCTPRAGDVIDVTTGTHTLNNGPPEASYSARWTSEPETSSSRDWVIGELFQLLVTEYFDVGHYTTYDVVVWFEGKTRSYRAVVFHHDLGELAMNPHPTFWDSIGAGGVLSNALAETRPPYGTGASKTVITP